MSYRTAATHLKLESSESDYVEKFWETEVLICRKIIKENLHAACHLTRLAFVVGHATVSEPRLSLLFHIAAFVAEGS